MNNDIEKLYKWGEDAFQKRNYDYAREMFMQIIALDPDSGDARKSLWLTNKKKHTELGDPSRFKIGVLQVKTISQLAMMKNKPASAAKVALDFLNEDPGNVKIRTALAEALHELGHIGGAIAELSIARDVDPNNVQTLKLLGAYLKERQVIGDAEEVLKRAQSLAPNDREIDKMLRDLAAMSTLKQGIEGATSYRDLIKNKSQAEDMERQGRLVKTAEDNQLDIDALKKSHAQNPGDAKIMKKIAEIYFDRLKDYLAAKEWFAKASAADPTDTMLKDRVDDSAIRALEGEIEKAKASSPAAATEAAAKLRKFQIASFRRRSADRPTDMSIRFELGKLYYLENTIDEAIGEFQNSVKEPRRKVDSYIYLGLCFWKKKMHDIAVTQFKKAFEAGVLASDKIMYVRYNMALCYADAGEIDKALEEGKKIMEVDISYKDISKRVSQWTEEKKT